MINLEIPGFGTLHLKHLVSDFNGTLSVDGKLLPDIKELLQQISGILKLHILTADTLGTAKKELKGIKCELHVVAGEEEDKKKEEYVMHLGDETVVAIGNGNNDKLMLEAARIGIAVTEGEGCAVDAILAADIHVKNAKDALELLINTIRLKATLRF